MGEGWFRGHHYQQPTHWVSMCIYVHIQGVAYGGCGEKGCGLWAVAISFVCVQLPCVLQHAQV